MPRCGCQGSPAFRDQVSGARLAYSWHLVGMLVNPYATVFCKNRDRLLDGDIAAKFFAGALNLPKVRKLLSSEHFSVDGTLIEAWASTKSFVPKAGGNAVAGRRWAQRRTQFPRRETHERHTFFDHRPRRSAVPQRARQRGQALSHGPFGG